METVLEAALVERCKAKDAGAFRELVECYKEQAYGFAFSYLRNSEDALSVSQDAFVRAWRFMESFRAGSSFRSWLFGIVRHLSLNHLERKQRLREISIDAAMEESGFEPADSRPDPQEALENGETRRMVWKAIMSLKEEFREVIVLKHFHDLSYREIAESLGVPEGTVMSRLYHARLALKKRLEPILQGE
jgi:RNA polymerase sigma-70 factor (ECF subfamily)